MLVFQNPNTKMILVIEGTCAFHEIRRPNDDLPSVIKRAQRNIKKQGTDVYHEIDPKNAYFHTTSNPK